MSSTPAEQLWRDCLSLLEAMTAGRFKTADALQAMGNATECAQLMSQQPSQVLPLSTMCELVGRKVRPGLSVVVPNTTG